MTDTAMDIRPGTIPAWAVRVAFNGEEWLLLHDNNVAAANHVCARATIRGDCHPYEVCRSAGFLHSSDCAAQCTDLSDHLEELWGGDSRAEADAAFDRIEDEWLGRDA